VAVRASLPARLIVSHGVVALIAAILAAHVHTAVAVSIVVPAAVIVSILLSRAVTRPLGLLTRKQADLAGQLEERIAELTAERDRLSAMLGGMVEGVIVLDPDGRVTIANRAASEILESEVKLVGRTIAETIRHPDARTAVQAALREGRGGEIELEAHGAGQRRVVLTARPISAGAGGGAVVVLHDVTRLRRLETTRRDFVANVSHELRTPVASIQGYAEALLDGALDDPTNARKFVDVIHRNATRLGRLVQDLLTLSQLEAQDPSRTRGEDVQLAAIAAHVAETVRERAAAAGATLEVRVPEDLICLGDPDWIEQILLNLVDNAIKYGAPRDGHVKVTAERRGTQIELAVEDDGPGIESRHLPRIFERFYRVDPARSSSEGSTGLGLAIVQHLATRMGGTVSVDSAIGRGSRFAVRLRAS
jgi:two-component system phosphate regulon sensor histidine kinase PhoR